MRHHRLFAAGLAAALMLGAASPALAGPGKAKGKANAPGQNKPKPNKPAQNGKKSKLGINGGGSVVGAGEFSVQARDKKLSKGHLNYTAPGLKLRCRGFEAGDVTFSLTAPATATFNTSPAPNADCVTTRADGVRRPATVVGTFTDGGQPADTEPPTPGPDSVDFTITDAVGSTQVKGSVIGNVKVRP